MTKAECEDDGTHFVNNNERVCYDKIACELYQRGAADTVTCVTKEECEADGRYVANEETMICDAMTCEGYWKTMGTTVSCVTKTDCEADGNYVANDYTLTCDEKETCDESEYRCTDGSCIYS